MLTVAFKLSFMKKMSAWTGLCVLKWSINLFCVCGNNYFPSHYCYYYLCIYKKQQKKGGKEWGDGTEVRRKDEKRGRVRIWALLKSMPLYLKWIASRTYCRAQGTLLSVMWQPRWEGAWGEDGCWAPETITISLIGYIAVVILGPTLCDPMDCAAHQASLSLTISWVCPSSCSLDQWCRPAISSSEVLFSFCPWFFPASGYTYLKLYQLHLKWITKKDLLYSTGNSAQCYVAAQMGYMPILKEKSKPHQALLFIKISVTAGTVKALCDHKWKRKKKKKKQENRAELDSVSSEECYFIPTVLGSAEGIMKTCTFS